MQRSLAALLFAALTLPIGACERTPETSEGDADVKLQVVKRKELEKALEGMRGKVVVLDVWADFCVPCKKEFPNLVALHQKYAGKGVACVSVSLDQVRDQEAALKFLRSQKATFANFLLDETAQVQQDYFDIYGPPAVLVYDRDGKLAQSFNHNDVNKTFSYADVEKLVQKLIAK